MSVWYTSDEHFGHQNVNRLCGRPFASLDEMHEGLIERHNARVRPGDTVFHLGDFAWKPALVAPTIARLHGRHVLVPGNHDSCHPMHRKSARARQRYAEWGLEVIDDQTLLEVDVENATTTVRLCHFPYASGGDSGHEARYPEWRPKNDGMVLLCGHVHESWRTGPRMFNVGVDVNGFAPVSIDEVLDALAKAPEGCSR